MWTEQWYLQFSPAPSKNGPCLLHGNLQWESYKLTCDRIDRVHSRLLINRSDSREDPIRFLLQRCGSNKVNLYVLFPVRLWRQNNILTSRFRPVEEAWCSGLLQCFYCPMLRRLVLRSSRRCRKSLCAWDMGYPEEQIYPSGCSADNSGLWQFGCCNPHTMPGHITMNKA